MFGFLATTSLGILDPKHIKFHAPVAQFELLSGLLHGFNLV